MIRYLPPNGTAGLARSRVRGKSRVPLPPASTMPNTRMCKAPFAAKTGSCSAIFFFDNQCSGDSGSRRFYQSQSLWGQHTTTFARAGQLPHAAHLLPHHRLAGLAAERPLELRQVGNDAVDAVLAGGVRIGHGVHAQVLWPVVLASPLRVPDEEPLIGTEAVDGLQVLSLGRLLPRDVGEQGAAQVGHIFPTRQLTVDVDIVHHDVLRVLILHAGDALV